MSDTNLKELLPDEKQELFAFEHSLLNDNFNQKLYYDALCEIINCHLENYYTTKRHIHSQRLRYLLITELTDIIKKLNLP